MNEFSESKGSSFILRTRVILGPTTVWNRVHVLEPIVAYRGIYKYSVEFLIPKTDTETVEAVKRGIRDAYRKGRYKLSDEDGIVPDLEEIDTPLHDGDLEKAGDETYAGMYYMYASTPHRPEVIDVEGYTIFEESEIYNGVSGRASVHFYAYSQDGGKGIACGLDNLQKVSDGPEIDFRVSAAEDFKDFIVDSKEHAAADEKGSSEDGVAPAVQDRNTALGDSDSDTATVDNSTPASVDNSDTVPASSHLSLPFWKRL